MHYSPYFLLIIIIATGTKASAMEACQTWMSLTLSNTDSSLDIYVSLKPEAIKILKLWISFWGCSTWISTRSCGMKKQSVQYTSHFSIHSMQAMAIWLKNGSSCLNCGISRELESWPFWYELLMHLCMVALWLFNKDGVCWHILLTSITYLPL